MSKDLLELVLDIGAALFAFLAAAYWFRSAYGELPQLGSYWDKVPKSDPFFQAIEYSAKINRIAALFSGLSAVAFAARIVADRAMK